MPLCQSPADGTALAYQDYGSGTPIVFVAGWTPHGDSWGCQLPFFLDQGFRGPPRPRAVGPPVERL